MYMNTSEALQELDLPDCEPFEEIPTSQLQVLDGPCLPIKSSGRDVTVWKPVGGHLYEHGARCRGAYSSIFFHFCLANGQMHVIMTGSDDLFQTSMELALNASFALVGHKV